MNKKNKKLLPESCVCVCVCARMCVIDAFVYQALQGYSYLHFPQSFLQSISSTST